MNRTCQQLRNTRGAVAVLTAVVLPSLLLVGCALGERTLGFGSAGRAPAPAGLSRDVLVGSWGIASYHDVKDRSRTERQAKDQCKQAYRIVSGPNDGVMMHVADDPKLYELRLKAGRDGRNFVGFEAPAGDPQDREILTASHSMVEMRFVDPDAHRRYGTFLFVRCS